MSLVVTSSARKFTPAVVRKLIGKPVVLFSYQFDTQYGGTITELDGRLYTLRHWDGYEGKYHRDEIDEWHPL